MGSRLGSAEHEAYKRGTARSQSVGRLALSLFAFSAPFLPSQPLSSFSTGSIHKGHEVVSSPFSDLFFDLTISRPRHCFCGVVHRAGRQRLATWKRRKSEKSGSVCLRVFSPVLVLCTCTVWPLLDRAHLAACSRCFRGWLLLRPVW